jgi:hypothetical protein
MNTQIASNARAQSGASLPPRTCSAVLFLDFDGVLNSCEWFQKSRTDRMAAMSQENHEEEMIDPDAVANLNRILEATKCQVVISSTWRRGRTMGALLRILVKRGLDKKHWDNFIGMTPVLDSRMDSGLWRAVERGHEIQAWLDKHPEQFQRIVILDDDGDMAHMMPHLVLTHGVAGLDAEKTEDVIRRLNAELCGVAAKPKGTQ